MSFRLPYVLLKCPSLTKLKTIPFDCPLSGREAIGGRTSGRARALIQYFLSMVTAVPRRRLAGIVPGHGLSTRTANPGTGHRNVALLQVLYLFSL